MHQMPVSSLKNDKITIKSLLKNSLLVQN